jgi:hypothetical protein
MIEIQPVAIEAAIAHQQAITNASHLLSCADYLLERFPEDVQEMPIAADLTILLSKVADEVQAARVKFETKEKVPPVAPWRKQQEQENPQTAPFATYEEIHGLPQKDDAYQAVIDRIDAALQRIEGFGEAMDKFSRRLAATA